jgi:hypothetical protein
MGTQQRINENGTLVAARLHEDIVVKGNIGGTGELVCDVEGASWASVDLRGGSLTCYLEGSVNGLDYTLRLPLYPAGQQGAPVGQLTGAVAAPNMWYARVAGLSKVRLVTSAYVSGPCIATLSTTMAAFPPIGVQGPEPMVLNVRPALSVANTALVVSIPAAGVGLYHIIHQIKIWGHNNSAAAVAPTATLAITSANMGVLAWNNTNAFGAWEKKVLVDVDAENGIRSAAANTATTISIPALGAGVQAEAFVLYKVGG